MSKTAMFMLAVVGALLVFAGPATAENRPFPQHVKLADGVKVPSNHTRAELDETVADLYQEFINNYLWSAPNDGNQMYICAYGSNCNNGAGPVTVSEATGYGMLLTAYMAGEDPLARDRFDSLYRHAKAHASESGNYLMSWQQSLLEGELVDTGGKSSAADGDLDIAYALLVASNQWGNNGSINYRAEAQKVIEAITDRVISPDTETIALGDWAPNSDQPQFRKAIRTSDMMTHHFKTFAKNPPNKTKWTLILNRTNQIRQYLVDHHGPDTGLLPDFAVQDSGVAFNPAPPGLLESDDDGSYNWNALRVPWRLGVDYALTGDPKLAPQLGMLNYFAYESTEGEPGEIMPGYELDGTPLTTEYRSIAFSAPFTVAAMANNDNPGWLNALWDHSANASSEGYYQDSIRLLSLLVASGNWWAPEWETNNAFRIVKKKVNRKSGVGKITIRTESPGKLTIKRTGKVRQATARAKAGKSVKLTVRAQGKAKRRLAKGKAVKVKFTVRFTPDGGTAKTRNVTLRLRKKN